MRVWLFFVLLLIVSLTLGIYISPEESQVSKKQDVALVEFENYQLYTIRESGISDIVVAYKGRHFKTHEELELPVYVSSQDGSILALNSNRATIKGDVITMTKDVVYTDSNGYQLITENGVYNSSNGYLTGSGGFVAKSYDGVLKGSDFLVKTEQKRVEAKNIKAVYRLKD